MVSQLAGKSCNSHSTNPTHASGGAYDMIWQKQNAQPQQMQARRPPVASTTPTPHLPYRAHHTGKLIGSCKSALTRGGYGT